MRTVVILLLLLLPSAHAGNYSLAVSEDVRRVMDLGVFGFNSAGTLELQVDSLSMGEKDCCTSPRAAEPIGFTLDWVTTAVFARKEKNYGKGEEARNKICFIEDPLVQPTNPPVKAWRQTFPLERPLAENGEVASVTFTHHIKEPGLYALFFYNCKGFSDKTTKLQRRPVSFRVRVSEFNENGGVKDYLAVGDSMLPLMYGMFALVFVLLSAGWVYAMRRESEHVHKIHSVMLVLVVFKALSLAFEALKFRTLQTSGVPSFADWLFHVFLTLKSIMLFLVILLLGTGWSFLKPVLSRNDKNIALTILPLQIAVNIAIAIVDEMSEAARSWGYWRVALRVADVLCCCVVLLPIVWSIKQLRSLGAAEGKVARNLSRLRQFRTFYVSVVGFIYFTRLFVVAIEGSLTFRLTWVAPFIQEVAAVAFYFYTGSRFRPKEDNPYLYLAADDFANEDLQEELAERARHLQEKEATGGRPGSGL
eukprot:Hpha_TRINITY_DN762_c0_g1::TRINITY_DN762_c0_g1_i2::g.28991::m.28991